MDTPQLGQMPNINLGGYIPAPAQNKLSRQVLGAVLENLAGRGIDKVLTPDYSTMLQAQGIGVPTPKWYEAPINAEQATRLEEQHNLNLYRMGELGVHRKEAATGAGRAETLNKVDLTKLPPEVAALTAQGNLTQAQANEVAPTGAAQRALFGAETSQMGANTDRLRALLPGEMAAMAAQTANTQGRTDTDSIVQTTLVPESNARIAAQAAQTGLLQQQTDAGRYSLPSLQQYPMAMQQVFMGAVRDRGLDANSPQLGLLRQAHMDYITQNPPSAEPGFDTAKWYAGYNRYLNMVLQHGQSQQGRPEINPTIASPYFPKYGP